MHAAPIHATVTPGSFSDFRSDTVTLPTPEMMQAVMSARLGDAARGEDPSVNELERVAAEITGMEEATFLPSGAMANLVAVIAHGCNGGEAIVEASSHIYNSEGGGLSVVAGAVPRPLAGRYGVMDPRDVKRAIRAAGDLTAPTRLLCIENTHNDSGGSVLPLEHLAEICAVAKAAGVAVHLDGARIFNAAACLDVKVTDICRPVDSVMFSLCKGLGGPAGAVLASNRGFIKRARRVAKMLGGGMRQVGLLAAPALVALRDPYPGHRRDNELARQLAIGLERIDASLVELHRVQTNIVNCYLDKRGVDAIEFARALAEHGVLVNAKRNKIRFVTHAQVDDSSVRHAVRAVADALEQLTSMNLVTNHEEPL